MRFAVEFEDAVQYMVTHRNQRPSIYNSRRCFELPLPNLELGDDDDEDVNISDHDKSVLNRTCDSPVTNFLANFDEGEIELTLFDDINGSDHVDTNQTDPFDDPEIDIKPDPLILFKENQNLIESLLSEPHEPDKNAELIFPKDCIMPMPIRIDSNDLVKRENDEMSGNLSFNEKVLLPNDSY